jgi:hypothetical protein
MLDNFVDTIVDEMPKSLSPIKSINHHIELILGASLSNKEMYRLTPRENEEVKNQVQELLDKVLVRESLSPCAVPIVLSAKKDGGWRMCIESRAIKRSSLGTNFLYQEWMI